MASEQDLGLLQVFATAFDSRTRLYALESDGPASGLVVERWDGEETVSEGFEWRIVALSDDACLSLDAMIGSRATLRTTLADGTEATRSGLIRSAELLGADGGLARYRLILVPWTWLLTQTRHSRVFQDKTVLEIVETVFATCAQYATWTIGEEVASFLADARPRSYCVQYRETDFAFVARLLAEEGLGFGFAEDASSAGGHRLELFADSLQRPEDLSSVAGLDGIRFHRAGAIETSDAVQMISEQHTLASSAVTVLSHDYKSSQSVATSLPLAGARPDVSLEDYDDAGAYVFASPSEAERYTQLQVQAREARAQTWFGRSNVRSFRAGTWFALSESPWAAFSDSPPELFLLQVRQAGVNNLPSSLHQRLHGLGTLPVTETDADLWARAEIHGYANSFSSSPRSLSWRPQLSDGTGVLHNPRPTAPGTQTALVVGPIGETTPPSSGPLYCDALGRIRIRFHWQDGDDTQASCWVRTLQRYAGPGVGAQFLPRIGQEVLVAFIGGDIDRPIVLGALYNGQGEGGILASPGVAASAHDEAVFEQARDHHPATQGNLVGGNSPTWHGMSGDSAGHRNAAAFTGVRSQSFDGAGYNQLVFDDSDHQGRVQFATTQAATQLNLGHLIHTADNYRGSFRGEGFELRTDAYGAVRATAGLLLTTFPQSLETPAGDFVPGVALLRQASDLAAVYSDATSTHQTVGLAAHLGPSLANATQRDPEAAPLPALLKVARSQVAGADINQALSDAPQRRSEPSDGTLPQFGDGLLGMAAQAGLGLIAGQSLQLAAGETISLASGQDSNLAAVGNWRLQTGQAIGWLTGVQGKETGASDSAPTSTETSDQGVDGLTVITAQGMMEVQAQHDTLKLQARDDLTLVSANADVELAAAKTVHLAVSGGASITIEDGNITLACPGTLTVHASKKSFVGATQLSREMNTWPESKFDERFRIVYPDGEAAKDYRYEIVRADGAIISGVTDGDGFTDLQQAIASEAMSIRLLGPT